MLGCLGSPDWISQSEHSPRIASLGAVFRLVAKFGVGTTLQGLCV